MGWKWKPPNRNQMKEKDWNHIAKIEKAIVKKYGKEAVQNPKSGWDEEKEKDYIQQLKEMVVKEEVYDEQSEKVEINGFLVPKKLLTKGTNKNCPVCGKFSLKSNDDICIIKYECCHTCFIKYVENREKRWKSGWRPETGDN